MYDAENKRNEDNQDCNRNIQKSQHQSSNWMNKQDGRLAPVYFSEEDKYFDQHFPTVTNKTTV